MLEAADKDPAVMQTLKETAIAADDDQAVPSVALQRPRRRQRLELSGEQCAVGHRLPQPHRDRRVEHLREPPEETKYIYTDNDSNGQQLMATAFMPSLSPRDRRPGQFWSLTILYNAEHFYHDNPLKRYSLGTKNKNLKLNADGSLTLYAGAKSPGKDMENNWLPAPEGDFLALYSCLLAGERHPRRHVDTTKRQEGELNNQTAKGTRRCKLP